MKMDRVIWFTSQKPANADTITNSTTGSCSFWNCNAATNLPSGGSGGRLLPGGHYLVLGPRVKNYIGTSGTTGAGVEAVHHFSTTTQRG